MCFVFVCSCYPSGLYNAVRVPVVACNAYENAGDPQKRIALSILILSDEGSASFLQHRNELEIVLVSRQTIIELVSG